MFKYGYFIGAILAFFHVTAFAETASTKVDTATTTSETKESNNNGKKEENKGDTKEEKKEENKEDAKEEKKEPPFTGTFDISTNYMWRGISLTDNLPAFQGGFSFTLLNTGLYVSLWGSNVKFLDNRFGTATVEVDAMGGINRKIGEHFTYNIYLERYSYPKTFDLNYNELIADLSFYIFTALIGHSNDVYGVGKSGTYYSIGINYDVPSKYIFNFNNMNISGGIGHYTLPRSANLRSYNDYNVKLSKTFGDYVLDVQWTDTNGRSVDEPHLKDSHFVCTLTANF